MTPRISEIQIEGEQNDQFCVNENEQLHEKENIHDLSMIMTRIIIPPRNFRLYLKTSSWLFYLYWTLCSLNFPGSFILVSCG